VLKASGTFLRRLAGWLGVAALALGLARPAQADALADIIAKGVIRIGVPADLPPFGMPNANRELEGFDIDLARLVAEALGVKLDMVVVSAPNRVPYLLTDKVDVICAILGLTPERAKQVMYSAPYANTALAVFGPSSLKVTSPAEVGSYKVSATKGTAEELEMTARNPKADIMRTEDNATALTAYLTGQAQLLATNTLMAIEYRKQNPGKEFELKFNLRRAPAHMAVRMGEHNLVRWLDSFVFFKTLDGTLDKLSRKWLGVPMDPLPTL